MEITVYRNAKDLAQGKFLLRAPITCPDTFDFMSCVSMFKNMFPGSCIMFTA